MKTIGAVTVGRSDFGIYLPVLRAIQGSSRLQLSLFVAAAHLLAEHGDTGQAIREQGFHPTEFIRMTVAGDAREAIAQSAGLGVLGFTQALTRSRPDLLLVLGDRFEMHSAVLAATLLDLPLAHIHGGEVTAGAFDDALRHSITKFSHLHFVSTPDHARRVRQLGEEPWRVVVSGAPGLDNLHDFRPWTREQLEVRLNLPLSRPPLLVTYHPVTLQLADTEYQLAELSAVLSQAADGGLPIIITRPNADPANLMIVSQLAAITERNPRVRLVANLGTDAYFSLMGLAAAMVGNSSSGIVEAASFELPVVNIGLRQSGRSRSGNVIDVGHSRVEIQAGLERALSPTFRASLRGLPNLYGQGRAAGIIVQTLEETALDQRLRQKQFIDWQEPA